jgi:stage II sporulation protein GA (sporulation sigma-E factor processing peptidase)
MKVYIDLVLILNFIIDLIILITTSYVLKRNVRTSRLVFGAFIGTITTLFLFIKTNVLTLFLLKVIISIIMTIGTFSYRNIRYTLKNISYLYIVSILLGGFLYFLNIQFSYKNIGFVFRKYGLSINYVFILLFSPIILTLYSKQVKELKNNFSNYYKVDIYLNNYVIKTNAFLDTGNKLTDPYLKRPVIILNKKKLIYDNNEFQMVLVPYKTITESKVLDCIVASKVVIKGLGSKNNVLVGLMEDNIRINGIDLILNTKLLEEINV